MYSLHLHLHVHLLLLLLLRLLQRPVVTPLTSAVLWLHGQREQCAHAMRYLPFVLLVPTARLPLLLRLLPSDVEGRRKVGEKKGETGQQIGRQAGKQMHLPVHLLAHQVVHLLVSLQL